MISSFEIQIPSTSAPGVEPPLLPPPPCPPLVLEPPVPPPPCPPLALEPPVPPSDEVVVVVVVVCPDPPDPAAAPLSEGSPLQARSRDDTPKVTMIKRFRITWLRVLRILPD